MRYAIIGAGAIGGYYGAKLQKAGFEVHFLLRSDYDHVQRHGLTIHSIDGDFALPLVHGHQTSATIPVCDVVIVALKTTANHVLGSLLPPWLRQGGGTLITLQNGLGVEPQLARLLPPDCPILGGLCFICSHKAGPGTVHHLDYGAVSLGAYGKGYAPQGITPTMAAIAADCEQAGIAMNLTADLHQSRWKKLVWNIPFNSLSVILSANTEEMVSIPETRQLVEDIMKEVQQAAAGQNVDIADAELQQMISSTMQMKPYLTSMKRDYDHHRPLEIDAIVGYPLNLAHQQGLVLPKMTMLMQLLQYLDQRNVEHREQSTDLA